jgi:nitrogen fixation protein
MSNVQSYNALIDRFKAFAAGHFILKRFSHGQIEVSDLEKFGEYPFMHVIPSNVTYSQGMKTFSFQIVLADLPRDKEDKSEYQREALSDLQRIAEDLIAEITNHRVLFGDLITVQNVSLEPFLEEFQHTLTGWTVSLDLLVPYYWDACSIPAEWNTFFEGGSNSEESNIFNFAMSIQDTNGQVTLVNDEETPAPNYYYGTNDEGVRGWYLLTDEVGLTCVTLPSCQTIIDIEAAIDLLQQDVIDLNADVALKANTADISAVGFSNDYNDLDNKPTIPAAQVNSDWNATSGLAEILNKPTIPDVSGFVPYTGATTNVDLGTYNLTADHIALNVSPSGAGYVVGATEWNNTIGSSQTLLKGGNVSLKNGVDLVARVVNKVTPNTTLTKAAYQAVRISGAQGGRLAVALAQANNDNNSADTIGIVCETIATNQEGFILTVGQLENINTTGSLQGETWADGDVLYLSPTTAGRLTNIKPTGATGHIVVVGYVEYAHANNGSIYVKVMNGWELDELHNVSITSPANNDILQYESATSLWKNKTVTYMWTVDFLEALQATFIAPYACSINSVTNVQNAPTITITKNGSAYTLGTSIALGDDLVITASTASVVNLNITQL